MRVRFKSDGTTASFMIAEAEPAFHEALRGLYYLPDGEGFSKHFAVNTPDLDAIFGHLERSADTLVRQAAGQIPVAWEPILEKALELTGGRAIDWCLVGSAALAVRGLDVHPCDVDLVTSGNGAEQLEEVLRDYRIEPLQRSEGWIWQSFGRAFLGGRLEWVGGVNEGADRPEASDFGPAAMARMETVRWRGAEIKVPPLDLQLMVNERRGRHERAALIRRWLAEGSR